MGYSTEVDTLDRRDWEDLLSKFDDANLFQTWAYGAARWGEKNLSHAVVKRNGVVVALAQFTMLRAPLYGAILGYATFGPVWQRRGDSRDLEHYLAIVRSLGETYVGRHCLAIRLRPWTGNKPYDIRAAMTAEERWQEVKSVYRTYLLDLEPSLADLRRQLERRWRANLRKAEAQDLRIVEYRGQAAIALFAELSRQTQLRKNFSSRFIAVFEDFYPALPEALRPRVFACESGDRPVAAAILSAMGNQAFYLNGASAGSGLPLRAGYALQWHILRVLKEMGSVRWYDLYGGLGNPGVRQFKCGIVGAGAAETIMPEFRATGGALSAGLLSFAEGLYEAQTYLRGRLADL